MAPENLQATKAMLRYFKDEKPTLFKEEGWPVAKIRRPFIFWLTSLSQSQKDEMNGIS